MVTNTLLRIEFIKVVHTKIFIGFVVAEHEVDGHQQAVFDRADGALFSPPPGQTMVLRFEIAVFGTTAACAISVSTASRWRLAAGVLPLRRLPALS